MPTISVMVKNFNAQYQDQNIGVRLSGAGCGLLGIVCIEQIFLLSKFGLNLTTRAPQIQITFHGSGDGRKASQNYPLRLGPGSFGSKLMDLDGLKVSNFQLKI